MTSNLIGCNLGFKVGNVKDLSFVLWFIFGICVDRNRGWKLRPRWKLPILYHDHQKI